MKKSEYCKKIAVGLVCACVFLRPVSVFAQIAASNPEGTKHNFKTFLNNLKNGVYLQKGMEYMAKGTAAIGDPLGTVSEYVGEDNMKKITEAKEKYEEYKTQAEEYKKEYDEYKKWAKEQYDAAKQMKDDAMSAVDTAKSVAEMAKDMPGTVGGMVDGAKGQLGGAIGSVTGEINGIAGSVGVDTSGITNGLTGQGSSDGGQGGVPENAGVTGTNAPALGTETGTPAPGMTASVSGTGNNIPASDNNVAASDNAISQSANTVRSVQQASQATADMAATAPQPYAANVSAPGAQVPSRQAFGNTVNNAAQSVGSLRQMPAQATVQKVDSAVATAEAGNRAVVNNVASVRNAENRIKAVASDAKLTGNRLNTAVSQVSDIKAKAAEPVAVKATVKEKAAVSNRLQRMNRVDAAEVKNLSIKQQINGTQINRKAVQPANIQLRRKTFRTLEKQSSLSNNEVVRMARISHVEPLAFAAFGPGMPDGGTDQNGTVLVPPTVGVVKGISSDDIQKPGTMDKVLVEMNDSLKGEQAGKEDVGAYLHQGERELIAAYIAEAYKAQKEIEDFGEKVVDSLETAPSNNEIDQYGNINEANKALVKAMNGFLQTKASLLALEAYENYINFKFSSPEENDEG